MEHNFRKTDKKALQAEFHKACGDESFSKLIKTLKLPNGTLMKYTHPLSKSTNEIKNCKTCKNLLACKNEIIGHYYLPEVYGAELIFTYAACKYQKKQTEENAFKKYVVSVGLPNEIDSAKMSDIEVNDKKRMPIIKAIDKFIGDYGKKSLNGLYLSGSFGSGKTFLVSACLNELAKQEVNVAKVYWPAFLKKLKEFNHESNELFEQVMKARVLLIDDIGAETCTNWSRDEILGTLLQYRMEEKLPTFFTSNLNLEELEIHLSLTTDSTDRVKARRIIERIKQLTNELSLISINRRK